MTMAHQPYTSDEAYFTQRYIESDNKFVELIAFLNGIAEKHPNGEEMFNKAISLRESSYQAHMAVYHAHDQLVQMDVGLAQVKALLRPVALCDEPTTVHRGAPLTDLTITSNGNTPSQAHDTIMEVSELSGPEFSNSGTSFVTPASKPKKRSSTKRKVDVFKPTQDMWGKRIKQSVLWKREYEDNKVQVPLFPIVPQDNKTSDNNETFVGIGNKSTDATNSYSDADDSKLPSTQA